MSPVEWFCLWAYGWLVMFLVLEGPYSLIAALSMIWPALLPAMIINKYLC